MEGMPSVSREGGPGRECQGAVGPEQGRAGQGRKLQASLIAICVHQTGHTNRPRGSHAASSPGSSPWQSVPTSCRIKRVASFELKTL